MKRFLLASMALLIPATAFAAGSGTANTTMQIVVPVASSVSCASPAVTVSTPGSQSMVVTCTITGNPNDFSASGNAFSPSSATLTSGANTLSAALQSSIISPDSSVTSITGNSSGFSGDLATGTGNTWKVQGSYTTTTNVTTPAGTYTSGTITYTWSFI